MGILSAQRYLEAGEIDSAMTKKSSGFPAIERAYYSDSKMCLHWQPQNVRTLFLLHTAAWIERLTDAAIRFFFFHACHSDITAATIPGHLAGQKFKLSSKQVY